VDASSVEVGAVRVGQVAIVAVALYGPPVGADDPVLAALDYLVVAGLGFAGEQPDEAWALAPEGPGPATVLACLELIGELIADWPEEMCAAHPDWPGFYRRFLTALTATRRAHAA